MTFLGEQTDKSWAKATGKFPDSRSMRLLSRSSAFLRHLTFVALYFALLENQHNGVRPMGFTDRIVDITTRPIPLRTLFFRRFFKRWPLGSYATRLRSGAVERPPYGVCMFNAALEAKALGHTAMTVVEMGVAGGTGLLCLCEHRKEIEKALEIEILIAGFDTGYGLPPSTDARDLLYLWPTGSFEMDRARLEKRIAGQAELILGNVAETVASWQPRPDAPIGAIMFDLDYYSSTLPAFGLLEKSNVLPRIWCYFDDICGYAEHAYSDGIGVRAAIRDFNLANERRDLNDHISLAYAFKSSQPEAWHQLIYVYHRLSHPEYNTRLSDEKHQLPLTV